MPLVVPGLTSNSGDDKTSGWMNQLMGKKLGDSSNETVCSSPSSDPLRHNPNTLFAHNPG